jgi:hypothetical protein
MARFNVMFPQYAVLLSSDQPKASSDNGRLEPIQRQLVVTRADNQSRESLADAQSVADSTNEIEMEPPSTVIPVPVVDESAETAEDNIKAAARRGICELQNHFREVYETSWLFWPLCDAINFRYACMTKLRVV